MPMISRVGLGLAAGFPLIRVLSYAGLAGALCGQTRTYDSNFLATDMFIFRRRLVAIP